MTLAAPRVRARGAVRRCPQAGRWTGSCLWTAALLLCALLAACAADPSGEPPTELGPPLPTTNRLRAESSSGAPMADVDVAVHDGDGRARWVGKTGADGALDVGVPAGGSVTLFYPGPSGPLMQTLLSPPPGLPLRFVRDEPVVDDLAIAPHVFTLAELPAGATQVRWRTTCKEGLVSAGQPLMLGRELCPSRLGFSLLLYAQDGGGRALAWGALVNEPAPQGTEAVQRRVSVGRRDFLSLDGELRSAVAGARATLGLGSGLPLLAGLRESATGATPLSPSLRAPAALGDAGPLEAVAELTLEQPELPQHTRQGLITRRVVAPADALPPRLALQTDGPFAQLDAPDDSDPQHLRISWQRPAVRADLGVASAAWILGNFQTGVWFFYFPPDREPWVRVPDVPPSLGRFALSAAALPVLASLSLRDYDGADDFADAVAKVGLANPSAEPALAYRASVRHK